MQMVISTYIKMLCRIAVQTNHHIGWKAPRELSFVTALRNSTNQWKFEVLTIFSKLLLSYILRGFIIQQVPYYHTFSSIKKIAYFMRWFIEADLIKKILSGIILQVVSACREVSGSISVFTDMLVQCCFCNEKFSFSVIYQVMVSVLILYVFKFLINLLK